MIIIMVMMMMMMMAKEDNAKITRYPPMQEYYTTENHYIHTINATVYTQTKIIDALTNQFNCPIEMAFS